MAGMESPLRSTQDGCVAISLMHAHVLLVISRMHPTRDLSSAIPLVSGGFLWTQDVPRTDNTDPATDGGYTQLYRNAHGWVTTKPDGTLNCFGLDIYGVTGCPNTGTPKPISYVYTSRPMAKFCALYTDTTIFCWHPAASQPVGTGWLTVATGQGFTALNADGGLWSWDGTAI
eukprot:249244-Prymnesium_polylepis.1